MTLPIPETPTVGLGRFIKESRFIVPSHQRDYSWTDVNVNTFLKDVEEARKNPNDIYFCGLMVFTRTSSPALKVLDGQQRLATTLMIFSAIRNWFGQYSAYRKWELQIEDQLLGSNEVGSDTIEPKLTLTPANNVYFRKYVIDSVPVADIAEAIKGRQIEDRNKTLLRAALLVNRHIEKRAQEFPDTDSAKDYFFGLIRFLTDAVQVVRFVVNTDNAAYTIFETLNDRGLELAPLDLVKNYLFSRAERHRIGALKEFEERWAEMMALLGSVRVDSFLRAFWASRYGNMEGTKLFAAFKKMYETPAQAYAVSVDLRATAEIYAALSVPSDPIWSELSEKVRQSVDALSIIGSSQLHPIILAAYSRFPKREMERLLFLLEVIAVRFQLVGRGRPGRMESLGARAARDIWNGKVSTASEVFSLIRELYTPDDEFKQKFSEKTENDGKKARYILSRIERQSLAREGKVYPDELIPGNVTLEHILPKSPLPHWEKEVTEDENLLQDMLHRLGNMCLLPEVNRALGNKKWSDKCSVYSRSRLRTTHTLPQYGKWDRKEISKRQGHMAELAAAAWRFQ